MNETVLFLDENGLVVSAITTTKGAYIGQVSNLGFPIVILPSDTDINLYLNKKYYLNSQFYDLPIKPTNYHRWDIITLSWIISEEDFEKFRLNSINIINSKAGDKILTTYPMYKQINLGRVPYTNETLAMFTYIDTIRTLSNIATNSITLATTVVQIREAEDTFATSLLSI